MQIVFTHDLWCHSSNSPVLWEFQGVFANCVLDASVGVLYVEASAANGPWERLQKYHEHMHQSPARPQTEIDLSLLYTDLEAEESKTETVKEPNIIKVINKTVNKHGIVELIVREPRSENERREIIECERASKARDFRRKEREGRREVEREIRRVK